MAGPLRSANGQASSSGHDYGQEAWEWTKLRKIARRQVDKFIALIPDTLRDGNLQSINKLRIASRRLEQILDLLYPKPRPRRIKKLRRLLKACRHTLGELRNYDALLAMVEESLAHKSASDTDVWKTVKEYLQDRRLQDAPETLERFGRINLTASYAKLKHDLDSDGWLKLVATNGERAKLAVDGGRDLINQRITKSLSHRWQAFEDAVEKSRQDPREQVIHRMRIAAKRLRYLTEAMEKLHIKGSAEIVAWLRTLQQLVGRWHDRELLEHAMTDMLAQPKFRDNHPGLRAEMKNVILRNRETKEALEQKFSWMTSHSHHYRETKQWLVQLLANGNGASTSRVH
jgi:CHAD domain-containing protein